ncbi:XRE family transcriptional regulator [Aeromicrobium sp. Root236]|uniref:helix-turn-helix transcriptional regulator n=1 Tax=Aeromicrobium sp. Root236 TaxID=1736498 RepID=UPI0006FF1D52|nr:helix-turn-helix transcriptional regulator [Aeromicrobium sp. Root236]KRC65006.1 XRE family transcriptional regulator [Aeromicrobium sp. Root236]
MDRTSLADFLRRRREALQPADVGLSVGPRRRAPGLRREEVAHLTGMSVDYYARLEQARSPQPSVQMLRALARTLRLSDDETDHLYRLAGHAAPDRSASSAYVRPVLLRVIDQLEDCAAFVISDIGVVLAQNRMSRLLQGDRSGLTGVEASWTWRWFAEPETRAVPPEEQAEHSRIRVAEVRATWSRRPKDPDVIELLDALLATGEEFTELWERHEVGLRHPMTKRLIHPRVGLLEVDCETMATAEEGQSLVILSAAPGTETYGKLELLRVLGEQDVAVTK